MFGDRTGIISNAVKESIASTNRVQFQKLIRGKEELGDEKGQSAVTE